MSALTDQQLQRMHAYWRAANYLSVGQIYLKDNPLLERPLTLDDVKPRLLGHWGTTPGLNFIYTHLKSIRTSSSTAMASNGSFGSSPGPTAFPAMLLPKRRAPFMKAGSSGIPCCTRMAPLWIILIWS
jgi:XFP N-terminal domain